MSNGCKYLEEAFALFYFVLLVYQTIQSKVQRSDPYIPPCALPHASLTQRRVLDFSDHGVKDDTPFTPSTKQCTILGQTSAENPPLRSNATPGKRDGGPGVVASSGSHVSFVGENLLN
jgi:hypothetical protein